MLNIILTVVKRPTCYLFIYLLLNKKVFIYISTLLNKFVFLPSSNLEVS